MEHLRSIPLVAALLVGGALSEMLEDATPSEAARILFLVGAAIMVAVAVSRRGDRQVCTTISALSTRAASHPLNDLES